MGTPLELLTMFGPSAFFLLAFSVGSSLAGYHQAVQAPKETCHTVYEDVSNRRCSTSYEQECSTEYRQDCTTEHVNQCKTDLQQECDTVTETKRECNTVLTEDCTAQYEQECKTVN